MAGFLVLNGWEVPVAMDRGDLSTVEIGSRDRATDGSLGITRIANKLSAEFTTAWLPPGTARALNGLLLGRGDHWSFDPDAAGSYGYSGKGLAASGVFGSVAAGIIAESTSVEYAVPKFGTGCIEVAPATSNLFPANVRTGTDTSGTTTGFGAVGGATIASSSAAAWEQSKSLAVTGTAAGTGAYAQASTSLGAGTVVTASVYLRAKTSAGNVSVQLVDVTNSTSGTAKVVTLSTAAWKRVQVSHTTGAGSSPTLRLQVTASGSACDFYADGFQLAASAYFTAFVDGSRSAGSLAYVLGEHRASDDLTVMCWARRSSPVGAPGNGSLLAIGTSTDYLLVRDTAAGDENPEVDVVANGTTATARGPIEPLDPGFADWRHVAVTLQRQARTGLNRLKIYGNGALCDSVDPTSIPNWGAAPTLYVGTNVAGGNIGGFMLDDLVVLPFALDDDQIAGVFALGSAFPDLPRLKASGLLLGVPAGLEVEMVPSDAPKLTSTYGAFSGTGYPDARKLSAKLEER